MTVSVGSEKDGCSALFAHTQFCYSLIVAVFMVVKFLVPMWTILCVFQPVEGDTRNSEVALASRYNLVRCFSTNMGLYACFSVCLIFMHVGHYILSCG